VSPIVCGVSCESTNTRIIMYNTIQVLSNAQYDAVHVIYIYIFEAGASARVEGKTIVSREKKMKTVKLKNV